MRLLRTRRLAGADVVNRRPLYRLVHGRSPAGRGRPPRTRRQCYFAPRHPRAKSPMKRFMIPSGSNPRTARGFHVRPIGESLRNGESSFQLEPQNTSLLRAGLRMIPVVLPVTRHPRNPDPRLGCNLHVPEVVLPGGSRQDPRRVTFLCRHPSGREGLFSLRPENGLLIYL